MFLQKKKGFIWAFIELRHDDMWVELVFKELFHHASEWASVLGWNTKIQKYKNTKQGQQETQTKNYSRYKTEKKESKKIGLSYFKFRKYIFF